MRAKISSWIGVVISVAVWILLRAVLQSVDFRWTVALLAAFLAGWILVLVRRWRSRPLPRPSGAAQVSPSGGESAEISYRRGLLTLQVVVFGAFGLGLLAAAVVVWRDLGFESGLADGAGVGCILGAGLFLPFAAWALVHLFRRDAGLIFDATGVTIGNPIGHSKRLFWGEIRSVREGRVSVNGIGQPVLAVELGEPGDYLSRQRGFAGIAARWTWRTAGDPSEFRIGLRALAASEDDLLQQFRHFSRGSVQTNGERGQSFATRHRKHRRRFGRRDEHRPHHHP